MPRGIGARIGVKTTVTPCARPRRAGCLAERLLDLRGVPVRPARLVRRDRAHHLAGEQVRPERAPGARGAGRGDDHDVVRLDQAGGQERGERDDGRGGVAAGHGDPRCCRDLLPRPGKFRQPGDPAARVRRLVVPRPRIGVGQAGSRARGRRRGRPGRGRPPAARTLRRAARGTPRSQPEPATDIHGVEAACCQRRDAGQMRVHLGDRAARAALPGHRAELQVGMTGQQPQQLASRVSARARHRDPRAHLPSARFWMI